jgi:hypothetical protein
MSGLPFLLRFVGGRVVERVEIGYLLSGGIVSMPWMLHCPLFEKLV